MQFLFSCFFVHRCPHTSYVPDDGPRFCRAYLFLLHWGQKHKGRQLKNSNKPSKYPWQTSAPGQSWNPWMQQEGLSSARSTVKAWLEWWRLDCNPNNKRMSYWWGCTQPQAGSAASRAGLVLGFWGCLRWVQCVCADTRMHMLTRVRTCVSALRLLSPADRADHTSGFLRRCCCSVSAVSCLVWVSQVAVV